MKISLKSFENHINNKNTLQYMFNLLLIFFNCYFSLITDMLRKIQSSACLLYVHLFTLGYPDCIPYILSSYMALRIIEFCWFLKVIHSLLYQPTWFFSLLFCSVQRWQFDWIGFYKNHLKLSQ